jgi:hypothetical protein
LRGGGNAFTKDKKVSKLPIWKEVNDMSAELKQTVKELGEKLDQLRGYL